MILVLNKMSTEGQGNTIVKIRRKDNRRRKLIGRKTKGIGKGKEIRYD